MKKIFWALTFAALLPWSIAAQDARQRTIATIIADALDQLPAAKQQDYNNIMNELMSTGTAGIVLLGEMLVPADKGKNASIIWQIGLSTDWHILKGQTRHFLISLRKRLLLERNWPMLSA